jgi:hypothetical protein
MVTFDTFGCQEETPDTMDYVLTPAESSDLGQVSTVMVS